MVLYWIRLKVNDMRETNRRIELNKIESQRTKLNFRQSQEMKLEIQPKIKSYLLTNYSFINDKLIHKKLVLLYPNNLKESANHFKESQSSNLAWGINRNKPTFLQNKKLRQLIMSKKLLLIYIRGVMIESILSNLIDILFFFFKSSRN